MEERKIYDAFISFSHRDREAAGDLIRALGEREISVWYDDGLSVGFDYAESVAQAISSAKNFILLIGENSLQSAYVHREVEFAIAQARDRSKVILPVVLGECDILSGMKMQLSQYQFICLKDSSSDELVRAADVIAQIIQAQKNENVLYDRLSMYMRSGAHGHAASVLCGLVGLKCNEILSNGKKDQWRDLLGELILLLETLQEEQEKDMAEEKSEGAVPRGDFEDTEKQLRMLIRTVYASDTEDLYYTSLTLRLFCYMRGLLYFAGITDSNDKHKELAELQALALEEYGNLAQEQGVNEEKRGRYPENEWKFILQTPLFVQNYTVKQSPSAACPSAEQGGNDDMLLHSVASFMKEGNKLFDIIGKRDMAQDFLRCLLLSYERLKAYCEVVGEKDVCVWCIDRITEVKEKLSSAKPLTVGDKAQTGIQTLLGLTVPKSGKFDLFISHKKEDMDIAADVYYFMKKNMKEAFFDKLTLPEMSKSQYYDAIMRALDGSSHFVVIFSDLAYLESHWVSLEMKIFQSEMDEGRKVNANFIMVVTNEVYQKIMESNKSILPIQYRRAEIMRVEDYKKNLLRYIDK